MIQKLLEKLPHKIILGGCYQDLGPLLVRYYLIGHPEDEVSTKKYTRFAIYLHHLLRSDVRTMHDHPWSFISIILKGSYIEHCGFRLRDNAMAIGKQEYKRFSILLRLAEWIHRLEMDKPCWTLVVRFRKRKSWSFFPSGSEPINWSVYDYDSDCV